MLKELRELKRLQDKRIDLWYSLESHSNPYQKQVEIINRRIRELQETKKTILIGMDKNPDIQKVQRLLAELNIHVEEATERTRVAAKIHYEIQGFNGKKSTTVEGFNIKITDTTNRNITSPELMLKCAREDGVYKKVIKSVKPIVNRKEFNSWVDLKEPAGVTVTQERKVKVERC
jgi:hypothetical protein